MRSIVKLDCCCNKLVKMLTNRISGEGMLLLVAVHFVG